MGTWMNDITRTPTLAEKIEFGHDASDVHLFWGDYVMEHPEYAELMGDAEWHEECAALHEETAIELEVMAQQQGELNPGCLARLTGRG